MAWMPARWALAGGLMMTAHPLILEWSHDYWGGEVALVGGALVLGAFRRLAGEPRARDAVFLGIGLDILANSRPYEGFVLALILGVALAIRFIVKRNVPLRVILLRVVAPLAILSALIICQVAYYNWRVTGNALMMPYAWHQKMYAMAPQFLFEKPDPGRTYRNADVQKLHLDYLHFFQSQLRSPGALARATFTKIFTLAQAYLWSFLMVVALLGLPWALARDRWLQFALLVGVFWTMTTLIGTWVFPHYAAPLAGLLFVLALPSMRILRAWHVGTWRVGRNLVRGLAMLCVISVFEVGVKFSMEDTNAWYFKRQAMLETLKREPGKSLVIVKYSADHNPNREWIYNEADIPGAKVILAQEMGDRDRELLDYFADRKAWVVNADAENPEPEPYR
jgi:hypothetical protein